VGESVLGVSNDLLKRVASDVGTPVYVYSASVVRQQWKVLCDALADIPHQIHYSVKANSNLALLALIRNLGAGADIVSGGELARVEAAGFDPNDVVFSGVGKTRTELVAAVDWGVGLINVESVAELDTLIEITDHFSNPVRIGLRVNPDVTTHTHPYTRTAERGMKFGVPPDQVLAMAQRSAAAPGLELVSVGMHLGSQISDPAHYREGAEKLTGVVQELCATGIHNLTSVDAGGGLAITYTTEQALEAKEFVDAVAPLHRATGLTLLVEPGRFLVGNAGVLLTRVTYEKHTGGRDFLIVDAGMNDFLRPSHYGAVHEVAVVDPGSVARPRTENFGPVDIVGPICETGDFLGLQRKLDAVGSGGLVAVCGAGAYGFSMSSTYNSRPRAAEVLIDGSSYAVVRRRESYDDLWRGEVTTPEWIG
jgi:diaminopimelate decarboxylase